MIHCIALDNEPPALDLITNFCQRIEYLNLMGTFVKPSDAAEFLFRNRVDLLFLDIQMPDITGIDFYKSLPEKKMVIFTTAYSEYATEGFNLEALDYVVKPLKFERFLKAVNKTRSYSEYINNRNTLDDQFIFVRSEYRLVKLSFSDIIYINGFDDYVRIYTTNSKPITAHVTLKALINRLPEEQFLRIHRSYIIAVDKITSIRNKQVLINKTNIPIGVSYLECVKNCLHLNMQ